MTATHYKAAVWVAAGLLAGSAALWFERTDRATVHAIDAAELGAGSVDRLGEFAGADSTNVAWVLTAWEVDPSVTNDWGGYQTFVLSAPSAPYYSGTYVFAGRSYGSVTAGLLDDKALVGGALDLYTNTAGGYAAIDGGPAGATYTVSLYSSPQITAGWWLGGLNANTNIVPGDWSAQWANVYTAAVFRNVSVPFPIFTATVSSVTFPTSGQSRVRHYSPHALRTYTNTIGVTFDRPTIAGIRSTTRAALDPSTAPCWIGPTNSGSDYDGVTAFPLVATSAWRAVYAAWYAGSRTNHATFVRTNEDLSVETVTNSFTNANLGIFVSTNELAWHYSAQYRLRDMLAVGLAVTNESGLFRGQGTTWADAFNDCAANFAAGTRYAASVTPTAAHATLSTFGTLPNATVFYDIALVKASTPPLYTNVSHTVEFYAKADKPAGAPVVFAAFGTSPLTTNAWSLYDSVGPATGTATSTVFGAWAFPDLSDLRPGTNTGWRATLQPVVRWHQQTATNAIFDGRYN